MYYYKITDDSFGGNDPIDDTTTSFGSLAHGVSHDGAMDGGKSDNINMIKGKTVAECGVSKR